MASVVSSGSRGVAESQHTERCVGVARHHPASARHGRRKRRSCREAVVDTSSIHLPHTTQRSAIWKHCGDLALSGVREPSGSARAVEECIRVPTVRGRCWDDRASCRTEEGLRAGRTRIEPPASTGECTAGRRRARLSGPAAGAEGSSEEAGCVWNDAVGGKLVHEQHEPRLKGRGGDVGRGGRCSCSRVRKCTRGHGRGDAKRVVKRRTHGANRAHEQGGPPLVAGLAGVVVRRRCRYERPMPRASASFGDTVFEEVAVQHRIR